MFFYTSIDKIMSTRMSLNAERLAEFDVRHELARIYR